MALMASIWGKIFQFWQEIWIQVVVILLQLYLHDRICPGNPRKDLLEIWGTPEQKESSCCTYLHIESQKQKRIFNSIVASIQTQFMNILVDLVFEVWHDLYVVLKLSKFRLQNTYLHLGIQIKCSKCLQIWFYYIHFVFFLLR